MEPARRDGGRLELPTRYTERPDNPLPPRNRIRVAPDQFNPITVPKRLATGAERPGPERLQPPPVEEGRGSGEPDLMVPPGSPGAGGGADRREPGSGDGAQRGIPERSLYPGETGEVRTMLL